MTNKLKYFVGNWKMFGSYGSVKILHQLHRFCSKFQKLNANYKVIFCIPNTLIDFFGKKVKSKYVVLGAQNCHYNQNYGPFTGSVSASMLKNVGAKYVILGHSENRKEGDTENIIKRKVESALSKKLNIIFCIGETYKEKKNKKTSSIIKKQLRTIFNKKYNFKKIIIAYEPVWSIGTGRIPKIEDLKKTFKFIKKEVRSFLKSKNSSNVLYGGSVNSKNIRLFSKIPEIDGFLIGGASQSSKKFIDIVKNYYK